MPWQPPVGVTSWEALAAQRRPPCRPQVPAGAAFSWRASASVRGVITACLILNSYSVPPSTVREGPPEKKGMIANVI